MVRLKFLRGCVVRPGEVAQAGEVREVPANVAAELIACRRAVVAPPDEAERIETREPEVEVRDPMPEKPMKRLYTRRPPK